MTPLLHYLQIPPRRTPPAPLGAAPRRCAGASVGAGARRGLLRLFGSLLAHLRRPRQEFGGGRRLIRRERLFLPPCGRARSNRSNGWCGCIDTNDQCALPAARAARPDTAFTSRGAGAGDRAAFVSDPDGHTRDASTEASRGARRGPLRASFLQHVRRGWRARSAIPSRKHRAHRVGAAARCR